MPEAHSSGRQERPPGGNVKGCRKVQAWESTGHHHCYRGICLLCLTATVTYGSTAIGAKIVGHHLHRDSSKVELKS